MAHVLLLLALLAASPPAGSAGDKQPDQLTTEELRRQQQGRGSKLSEAERDMLAGLRSMRPGQVFEFNKFAEMYVANADKQAVLDAAEQTAASGAPPHPTPLMADHPSSHAGSHPLIIHRPARCCLPQRDTTWR